jgi:hypothetical protein
MGVGPKVRQAYMDAWWSEQGSLRGCLLTRRHTDCVGLLGYDNMVAGALRRASAHRHLKATTVRLT